MKNLLIVLSTLSLSGCIAVWGQSYNIDHTTPDFIQINYDSSVVNYPALLEEVEKHCAQYGKEYTNDSSVTNGWGITMAIYKCVDKDS